MINIFAVFPFEIHILRLKIPPIFAYGTYFTLRNRRKQVLKTVIFPPAAGFPLIRALWGGVGSPMDKVHVH